MQPDHWTNDPRWDYTQCRCENNGDQCDYCADLDELIESERAEAEEKKYSWMKPLAQVNRESIRAGFGPTAYGLFYGKEKA